MNSNYKRGISVVTLNGRALFRCSCILSVYQKTREKGIDLFTYKATKQGFPEFECVDAHGNIIKGMEV